MTERQKDKKTERLKNRKIEKKKTERVSCLIPSTRFWFQSVRQGSNGQSKGLHVE